MMLGKPSPRAKGVAPIAQLSTDKRHFAARAFEVHPEARLGDLRAEPTRTVCGACRRLIRR